MDNLEIPERTDKCLVDNAINYLELAKLENFEKDFLNRIKNAINQLELLLNKYNVRRVK